MAKYLIDVNLPYYFSPWSGPDYIHVRDLNDEWTDGQVWSHAKRERLTIVSKDADFSARALIEHPPPRVIHIRIGNLRMREFHERIFGIWSEVCELSTRYRLVHVFRDRIEGID
jgi:predicted nuclease of predicted toxin-antitoxin system